MNQSESLYNEVKRRHMREINRNLRIAKMRLELAADMLNFPASESVFNSPSKLILPGTSQDGSPSYSTSTRLVLSGVKQEIL